MTPAALPTEAQAPQVSRMEGTAGWSMWAGVLRGPLVIAVLFAIVLAFGSSFDIYVAGSVAIYGLASAGQGWLMGRPGVARRRGAVRRGRLRGHRRPAPGARASVLSATGGYGAPASSRPIALVTEAIAAAGRRAPDEMGIALDVAATHLVRADGSYHLDGRRYTREGLAGLLAGWVEDFPVLSVEDPFGEDDWVAWQDFAAAARGCSSSGTT